MKRSIVIARSAARHALRHQITDRAAAITYYAFLALPSLLVVAVGAFALAGGASGIDAIISRVDDVAPAEAVTLIRTHLERTTGDNGVALIGVGGLLALWTTTGAMTAVMRAVAAAHGHADDRGFVRSRMTALAMLTASGAVFLLLFALLVLGPHLSEWVGDATGRSTLVKWLWWTCQWPVLGASLLLLFSTLLYLAAPDNRRRWVFLSPGAVVASVVWLAASGGFSLYVAWIGSYSATWGALAAVIILLTWLWISALALLIGAEIDAEIHRLPQLAAHESPYPG
jgi:membrane protein